MFKFGGKPNANFYIRNIANTLRYIEDEKLSPYHITNQQARILGAIRRSIHDGHVISRSYLQEIMQLSGPSITSLLNGLEKNDFIKRTPAKNDKRSMQIELTKKGEDVVKYANEILLEVEHSLLDNMSEKEKDELISLLHKAFLNISPDAEG